MGGFAKLHYCLRGFIAWFLWDGARLPWFCQLQGVRASGCAYPGEALIHHSTVNYGHRKVYLITACHLAHRGQPASSSGTHVLLKPTTQDHSAKGDSLHLLLRWLLVLYWVVLVIWSKRGRESPTSFVSLGA